MVLAPPSAVVAAATAPAVPWGGAEILGLFALLELFWPAVAIELLQSVHFFGWFYGPTFPDLLKESADPNAQVIARVRVGIWVRTVALPFMAVTGPLLLALCSGTRLYQLGLHTHRLGCNLLTGFLAWLMFTPFLTQLWLTLVWVLARLGQTEAEEHPLTKLGQHSPGLSDRLLLVFTAVVAAPFTEEILFRGALLPWLNVRRPPRPGDDALPPALAAFRQRSFRQGVIVVLAVIWALLGRSSQLAAAWHAGNRAALLAEMAPVLFIGNAILGFAAFRYLARRGERAGKQRSGGSGLCLRPAVRRVHSTVWPSPIPLLLLGFVLGYLTYRTQSLIPSLVVHALFNGIACVLLFFPQLLSPFSQPEKGKEETSALVRPVAVSTSTAVPASQ